MASFVSGMDFVRVTESAAVAAARMRGRGDGEVADRVAVDAMRRELNRLSIDGLVVIGEGERDKAPMLYIGEKVGLGKGPRVDVALDPLEGTTICAKGLPNASSIIAVSEPGGLLHAPDVYMEKIAVGPCFPEGIVDLDADPRDNVRALAQAKGCGMDAITVCILERPRHASLIEAVRATGAAVRLISDGDVVGVIHAATPSEAGIDLYVGIGGAPEGVLAAAALRCLGGQMQARLVLDTPEKVRRAAQMGIKVPGRKYSLEEMAGGDVLFCATGVTGGDFLQAVRFNEGFISTETVVMCSAGAVLHRIQTEHRRLGAFPTGQ